MSKSSVKVTYPKGYWTEAIGHGKVEVPQTDATARPVEVKVEVKINSTPKGGKG